MPAPARPFIRWHYYVTANARFMERMRVEKLLALAIGNGLRPVIRIPARKS